MLEKDVSHIGVFNRLKENLPERPYCSNDYTHGLKIRSKEKAIGFYHLQINKPWAVKYLLFDIDRPLSALSDSIDTPFAFPKPTIVTVNRDNGHHHVAYELQTPVFYGSKASQKAIAFLNAVRIAYVEALAADRSYVGLITKNPFNSKWNVYAEDVTYALDELADYIELDVKKISYTRAKINQDYASLGRHCNLFELGRLHAYSVTGQCLTQDELYTRVHDFISTENSQFPEPLAESECRSITKSISKWVWRNKHNFEMKKKKNEGIMRLPKIANLDYQDFCAEKKTRQSLGASYANTLRKEATKARIEEAVNKCLNEGLKLTVTNIAKLAGVSRQTIYKGGYVDLANEIREKCQLRSY